MPAVGDVLGGKYRLDAVLGEGGFGRVYRATELGTQRAVAVKLLKRSDIKTALRFKREARTIARLTSENTLTLFDHGEHDGCLYMVTEFVAGEDLSDRMHRDGPISERDVVHILVQVLRSLQEAHEHGVLHRDIKPSNIRLFEYGGDALRVKVLDFGIAKGVDGDEVALTRTGAVIGTPRYMSPEHLIGEPLSPATDIFSLGIVAMEALLGPTHPLLGDLSNRLSGFQLDDESRVSEPLRATINRMLAQTVGDRYQSAVAVRRDLEQLTLAQQGRSARPKQPRRKPLAVSTAPVPAPSPDGQDVRRAVSLAVTALAVCALLLFAVSSGDDPVRAQPQPRTRVEVPLVAGQAATDAVPKVPDAGPAIGDANRPCSLPFTGGGYIEEDSNALDAAKYYTYIPEGLDPGIRHPLFVLLHQQGHTGEILAEQGGFLQVADEQGVILVAPTETDFSAWSPYDVDTEKVVAMLHQFTQTLCVDPDLVFAVGHGSGAPITKRLACRGLVAGVATHALGHGKRRLLCPDVAPTPRLMMYPKQSGYEPFEGGETCSGATRISVREIEDMLLGYHGCARRKAPTLSEEGTECWSFECTEAAYESCHVAGGHGWPGTSIRGRQYRVMDCDGPNPTFPMAEHIWAFFAPIIAAQP